MALTFILNNWKLILGAVGLLIVLGFLGFRSCNQILQENENEIIPINEINVNPKSANDNCVRVTGQPCPRSGK